MALVNAILMRRFAVRSDLQHDVGERFPRRRVGRGPKRDVDLSLDLVLEEADVATESGKLLKYK